MASEAQCHDFNTDVSALLKIEDVMAPLDNMSSQTSAKYQELFDSISSSNEILKTDFVIYGSSPPEPKLQEVQMKTNEFFIRLGETTQAIFDKGVERAKQEVEWLIQAVTEEMERLMTENEMLANENRLLIRENAYLAANNDDGSNNAAIEANNAAIEANNERIEANNIEIEKLEKKLEQCNAHKETLNVTADYTAKIRDVASSSSSNNQSRDSKIVNYANSLATAMGKGDKDGVDQITEDMYTELGIDQKGLEKELGRLYTQANKHGEHFEADELRKLGHSIQTGKGITPAATKSNSAENTPAASSFQTPQYTEDGTKGFTTEQYTENPNTPVTNPTIKAKEYSDSSANSNVDYNGVGEGEFIQPKSTTTARHVPDVRITDTGERWVNPNTPVTNPTIKAKEYSDSSANSNVDYNGVGEGEFIQPKSTTTARHVPDVRVTDTGEEWVNPNTPVTTPTKASLGNPSKTYLADDGTTYVYDEGATPGQVAAAKEPSPINAPATTDTTTVAEN